MSNPQGTHSSRGERRDGASNRCDQGGQSANNTHEMDTLVDSNAQGMYNLGAGRRGAVSNQGGQGGQGGRGSQSDDK